MDEKTSTESSLIEQQKHELELQRFELEKQKHTLERQGKAIECQRVMNDSIDRLLNVVQYLNMVQDGERIVVDEGYRKITSMRTGRVWNAHEEAIANVSLIALDRMATWLADVSKSTANTH